MSQREQRKIAKAAFKEAVDEVIRLLRRPIGVGESVVNIRANIDAAIAKVNEASVEMERVYHSQGATT